MKFISRIPPIRPGLATLAGSLLLSLAASAETQIFLEDFESYGVLNPTTGDAAFEAVWTYSGAGGTNATRTFFSPAGSGSRMNSIGWITLVDGSTITTTIPLASLLGTDAEDGSGNILPAATFHLSWVASAETSSTGRSTTCSYAVAPSAGTTTFVSGGNADASQVLTSFADTFTVSGGGTGKSDARSYTVEFTTSGMTTANSLVLSFTRDSADAFTFIDDIGILVNPDGPAAPTVVNAAGTSTLAGTAELNGDVTDNGNEDPTVTIYFGASDGADDPNGWDDSVSVGAQSGTFSVVVDSILGIPLDGGTTYFFRSFAENSVGSDWADSTESVTTLPFAGVPDMLNSANFDYRYEMDVDPSSQDLDGVAGANDFWIPTAVGSGVDQTMWIPQTYAGGIAFSNQAGVDPEFIPEALFRTDFGNSLQRQSILDDFTVEVSINLAAGTQTAPAFDLGGFAMFLNPPGQNAFRINIDEEETSLGQFGDDFVTTTSNTDALHTFRVAYVAADRRFWAWRDDVLIYGGTVNPGGGLAGSEASVFVAGGFLIGDFAFDITGDWEIDYLRIHNAAVAPGSVVIDPTVAITSIEKLAGSADVTLSFTVDPPQNVEIWKSSTGDGAFIRIAENVGTTVFIDPTGTDDTTLYQVRIP